MSKEIAEHVTARKVLTGTAVKRVVPDRGVCVEKGKAVVKNNLQNKIEYPNLRLRRFELHIMMPVCNLRVLQVKGATGSTVRVVTQPIYLRNVLPNSTAWHRTLKKILV